MCVAHSVTNANCRRKVGLCTPETLHCEHVRVPLERLPTRFYPDAAMQLIAESRSRRGALSRVFHLRISHLPLLFETHVGVMCDAHLHSHFLQGSVNAVPLLRLLLLPNCRLGRQHNTARSYPGYYIRSITLYRNRLLTDS